MGDVKLIGVILVFFGPLNAWVAITTACMIACLRLLLKTMKTGNTQEIWHIKLAFGYDLMIGSAIIQSFIWAVWL